jgi:hypothetical protein
VTRRTSVLVLAVALAALVGGCGSDDSGGNTVVVTETVGTATGTVPTGTTTGPAELTDSGLKPSADGFLQFHTPSGNIGCTIASDELRCDIRKKDWTSPPQAADCDLDYGDSIVLGGGVPPKFGCHGDTTLGAGAVLPYNSFVQVAEFRCESRESGLTCSNDSNGFFLSRESYRLTPS